MFINFFILHRLCNSRSVKPKPRTESRSYRADSTRGPGQGISNPGFENNPVIELENNVPREEKQGESVQGGEGNEIRQDGHGMPSPEGDSQEDPHIYWEIPEIPEQRPPLHENSNAVYSSNGYFQLHDRRSVPH